MISAEELDKEIEALVAEHCKPLERFLQCKQIRLPAHLVDDVINDVLLVYADKRRRGHTIHNVRSYLFTVARNAAIDHLKNNYASGIPDSETVAEHYNGYDMLASAEISQNLRQAIKRLPGQQRRVIELRYLGDFTVEETAEILNIAKGTVGPTTTAALRNLKQLLQNNADQEEEPYGL